MHHALLQKSPVFPCRRKHLNLGESLKKPGSKKILKGRQDRINEQFETIKSTGAPNFGKKILFFRFSSESDFSPYHARCADTYLSRK